MLVENDSNGCKHLQLLFELGDDCRREGKSSFFPYLLVQLKSSIFGAYFSLF